MAPHAALNTSDIGEKARRDLLQLLEGVRGKKNLVLEKALAGPLNLLVKFSTLQEYGVDKPFFLENDNIDSSQRNIVFLARGEKAKTAIAIADQIKRLRRHSQVDHEFSIFWVPRRTLVSDTILEEAGVLGEASIAEYPLYFVPLADDLLSLELDDAFSDLYLRKDPDPIFMSAKALMLLQQQHGLFPRILGKGDNAKRLADLLVRMRNEVTAGEGTSSSLSFLGLTPSSSIESLIIIDREVDMPTVLLTQLTYEGLIDEIFNIQSNQTEVDSSIIGTAASQANQGGNSAAGSSTLKRKVPLDPKDSLYSTLSDSNFAVVGTLLNKVARRLASTYDNRQIASKTTSELRDFVAKLPGYQAEQASLKLHTSLAEEIIKHTRTDIFSRVLEVQQNLAAGADPSTQHDNIEELIARDVPLPTILRLLCLYSTISNGIRTRDLENFKRLVLQAYGPQHILTISRLEKLSLLTPRASSGVSVPSIPTLPGTSQPASSPNHTNYNTVRKALHLIVDEVNETAPQDIAYVYSGYAPLSVRLVQCVLQKSYLTSLSRSHLQPAAAQAIAAAQGWRHFEDVLRHVRGATVDETQTLTGGASELNEKAVRAKQTLNGSGAGVEKTVVVFFLGGVCRAEVAALRFVERRLREEGKGRKILIATTGVMRGDAVVGAAVEGRRFEGAGVVGPA